MSYMWKTQASPMLPRPVRVLRGVSAGRSVSTARWAVRGRAADPEDLGCSTWIIMNIP